MELDCGPRPPLEAGPVRRFGPGHLLGWAQGQLGQGHGLASDGPSDEHTGHGDASGAASLGYHDSVIGGPCLMQETCRERGQSQGWMHTETQSQEGTRQAVGSGRGSGATRAVGTVECQLVRQVDAKQNGGRSVGCKKLGTQACAVGSTMMLGEEPGTDEGKPPLTLHVQLGPPAVTLNEDSSAQEGCPAQSPDEGAEHEGELQGSELGQEGGGPAPAEAVGDLQGDKKGKPGE